MARKENPIIVESVEFDYVGTDEQFNTFLKSIIKDYLTKIICCPMTMVINLISKSQHNSWILEMSCDMLWLHRGGVTTIFK